jgi:hypothetical protein
MAEVLQILRPYGRATSALPGDLDEAEARRSPEESLHRWFVRVVDRFCGGEPKRTALEDNLAIFVKLAWRRPDRLVYANIQTIVTASDLDDFYLDADAQAQYLRLDFDYKTLGDPFSHPLVHIHVEGELSPRFALDGGNSSNIVVDYLEFLYRNYAPVRWLEWAEREWNREFARAIKDGRAPLLGTIADAFTTGQIQILQTHSALLTRFKRALRKRKDEFFDLGMDGADRELLEYPLTR